MDDHKVHVITAGGAGGAGSAKKKKKSKKNTAKSHAKTTTTTTTTIESGDGTSSTGANKREASTRLPERIDLQNPATTVIPSTNAGFSMEMEDSDRERDDLLDFASSPAKSRSGHSTSSSNKNHAVDEPFLDEIVEPVKMETLIQEPPPTAKTAELFWLFLCFLGIMVSFVVYGVLLEYTTSGGRKLHELSFLFVTSALYTITAAAGRYVRAETPTTIPPARFAILGLTSMGSTFCSVRSLRYVRRGLLSLVVM
jgi:hypothetical protein